MKPQVCALRPGSRNFAWVAGIGRRGAPDGCAKRQDRQAEKDTIHS